MKAHPYAVFVVTLLRSLIWTRLYSSSMPFTPTHIAAALPIAWLCRWQVPFTALVCGTVVVDVGVFFPFLLDYRATHSISGIFTHCVPIGLLLYYTYHLLLKRPFVDLLPLSARNKLLPFVNRDIDFSLTRIALVAALIAVGAATHVFWDSFTHPNRWGVRTFPILQTELAEVKGWPIHLHLVLQHGSSVLILPPLITGFALWVRRQEPQPTNDNRLRVKPWIPWAVIGLMIACGVAYMTWFQITHPHMLWWVHSFRRAVKDTGAAFIVVALIYCAVMHYYWYKNGQGAN